MTQSTALLPVAPEGVRWTPCSLAVTDPTLSFERYEDLLRAAATVKSAASFWIGDLILFGDARYGERYAQATEVTGLRPETLQNYVSVCKRVAPSRRRETLTFGHHEVVARLEPEEQDTWLQKAIERGWRRDELRDAIRDAGRLQAPPTKGKTSRGREVLTGGDVVDAARDLAEISDVLRMVHQAHEGATIVGLEQRIPAALRAVEGATEVVTAASLRLARPSLLEHVGRVLKEATRSSGFAMVPIEVFEALQTAYTEETR